MLRGRGQTGAAPQLAARQPPEQRTDPRTDAFCFRSSAECERSTLTPCGLREGPSCREDSATACAYAGAGFTYYCPLVATQVDPKSGSSCYRRKTECERTTSNDCSAGSKPCIRSASLCGNTDLEFNFACPPGGGGVSSQQQQAAAGGGAPQQQATGAGAGARINASTDGRSTG